jgi:predicted lipid-binding transport protein (Tim44 family)
MTGHEFHLAAAGGGSAGFGGGGEGGGGGGKGFALYIILQLLIRIAVLGHGLGALVLLGIFLIWLVFTRLVPRAQRRTQQSAGPAARRRVKDRERRVEAAAAEAAEDDPAFAPDNVRKQAAALFCDIQAAWNDADRARLGQLVAPGLFAEWMRRLDDFARRGWHNRVQLIGAPRVEYVSLQHRGTADEDRVVVRVEAKLRDYVEDGYGRHMNRDGRLTDTMRIREFWTLSRRGDQWILYSIEQGREGMHALNDQLVATPWADERQMRDEALVEGAVASAVPEGTSVAEVADVHFEGSAQAAAMDLSVADGRFSPDVLEVAARRVVAAWAEAVDGKDDGLYTVAKGHAIRDLLHPGDPSGRTRLVVRGPQVKRIRITGLDAAAQPPTMTIDVDIVGRRYIEDRDTTAVLAGSKSRTTGFTEHWTLALDGDAAQPWSIVAVGSPLARA